MLVRQAQAIEAERDLGVGRRRGVLELGDHRLAAAGIAGDAVDGEGPVRRRQPGLDERPHQGDEAGRPAARIGDPARDPDHLALAAGHFREAIGPVRRGAVGGGGVDDAHAGAFDQGHGLARRLVRQAEDHRVGGVEQLAARLDVLAALGGDGHDLQVAPAGQPLADLDAGGPGLAIDEHLGHGSAPSADRITRHFCREAGETSRREARDNGDRRRP
jgi:hypothetical protein